MNIIAWSMEYLGQDMVLATFNAGHPTNLDKSRTRAYLYRKPQTKCRSFDLYFIIHPFCLGITLYFDTAVDLILHGLYTERNN